jgi:hypothetical protein
MKTEKNIVIAFILVVAATAAIATAGVRWIQHTAEQNQKHLNPMDDLPNHRGISLSAEAERIDAGASWAPVVDPIRAGLDEKSYWLGYGEGYKSADIPLSERTDMHLRCDFMIIDQHLDKKSFDDGFVAGTYDADHKIDSRSSTGKES